MPDDWKRFVRQRLKGTDCAAKAKVVEEVSDMLKACQRQALQGGASQEEARLAAEAQVPDWGALRREIEQIEATEARAGWLLPAGSWRSKLLTGIGPDLYWSLRMLAKHPAFSAMVVLTLALGIGVNTAIFSMVDSVLLKALPYENPEQLVRIFSTHPEKSLEGMGVSTGDVVEWRRRNTVFDGIGAFYVMGRTLLTEQTAQVVNVAQVSEDFFSVLKTIPRLGRTFTVEETAQARFNSAAAHVGSDPVAVLSHRAWQNRFGGDPSILQKSIVVDRQNWRVIGVMPADFEMPSPAAELWIPWSFEGKRPHDQRYLGAVARLKGGVTLQQAQAQMNAVAEALGEEIPASNEGWRVSLVPLHDYLASNSKATLVTVFGAVAVALLIACLNVASLQLVRAARRRKEVALRLALGASRLRLVRQSLSESLLLALLGGLLAIPFALTAFGFMESMLPDSFLRLDEVELNLRVLVYAALLTISGGVIFGLVPMASAPRRELAATMHQGGGRTAGGTPRWERLRKALVVSEVAMAVALLAAAGLLVRSFVHLTAVEVGFRPHNVVVLPITLDNHEYNSGAKCRTYYQRLSERLAGVPGVISVGGVTALPMSPIGPDFDRPIWAEGETPPTGGSRRADIRMATPGYFRTLGISLVQGRVFDQSDTPESPKVVVVNQSLAGQIWPDQDPVGKNLVIDYSTAGTYPYQVVGVVNDLRFYGIRSAPRPELYLPHAQRSYLIMNMAVRTAGEPEALVSDLRQAVLEVDPMQPAYGVMPLAELVESSIDRDRFAMLLIGSFGAVALVLALLGIFGVLSYHVGQRTQEVGIRAALGATRKQIMSMVLSAGLRLTLAGIALGVLLALASTRLLASLLFGVDPLDPLIFLIVTLLPAVGALLACYLPAQRAARLDPVIALRHE